MWRRITVHRGLMAEGQAATNQFRVWDEETNVRQFQPAATGRARSSELRDQGIRMLDLPIRNMNSRMIF